MTDIVHHIRKRFPKPVYSDDGLLANEAAEIIEEQRLVIEKLRKTVTHLEIELNRMVRELFNTKKKGN